MEDFPQATEEKPLFLFLDSLDQLHGMSQISVTIYDSLSYHSGVGNDLRFIPLFVSPNVYIIVSSLPKLGKLLHSRMQKKDSLLELQEFAPHLARLTFNSWTIEQGKKVTDEQEALIMDAFSFSPTPLFLRLVTGVALNWNSFTPSSSIYIGHSVIFPPLFLVLTLIELGS